MSEKVKRISVSLRDFLRVAVVKRDEFDTPEKAANALGMTLGSFSQRMTRERKAYPSVFEGVASYSKQGPKRATEDEALALLEGLRSE